MEINTYSARCGAGKTYKATKDAATTPGRYVIAVDRKAVGEERQNAIREFAERAGTNPVVMTIFSAATDEEFDEPAKWTMSVPREIEAAAPAFDANTHVILIITHKGLKLANLSGFDGWELIIDEVPSVIEYARCETGDMREWLALKYKLTPTHDQSALVSYIGTGKLKHYKAAGSRDWREFYELVMSGRAHVNFTSWDDAPEAWACWRLWEPDSLRAFSRVTILADSLEETESYRLLKCRGATFKSQTLPDPRHWQPRHIDVRYFAADHLSSSNKFRDKDHKPYLKRIASWLRANSGDEHLITCNDYVKPIFSEVPGVFVTPKQAGTNRYSGLHTATMIYSAKPSPEEIAMFKTWGITADQLTRSREQYDLNQFFLRSSARIPESETALEFRVYDQRQAELLAAYLEYTYKLRATLIHEDLNEPLQKKAGRPERTTPLTDEERRASARERQRKSREKKRKLAK